MSSSPPPSQGNGAHDATAERLARLSPQQRELLLRQLAARKSAGAAAQPIRPRALEPGAPLPLSAAQQRMWFFERLQPGTGAYHVYAHLRLRGALDAGAVQRAFAAVIARHESLRTGFGEVAGEPRQTVAAQVGFAVPTIDLSDLDPQRREAELQRRADEETVRPFDLARPPLLRATLVRLDRDDHALLVVLHHIVSDAWSLGVLFDEFNRFYAAQVGAAAEAALAPPALQFGDCVLWQREPAHEQTQARQLAFWRDALAGTGGLLDLPTDRPRSSAPLGRGARYAMYLPPELVRAAGDFAKGENATLFMLLLAAFQTVLARNSGQDDVVVGSPVANRGEPGTAPLIGLFVNTLPLRGDLSGEPSLRELLRRTRGHVLDAMSHADAPLERVIDELKIERAPGRTPLFQTLFVLQNAVAEPLRLHGLDTRVFESQEMAARFEITLTLGAASDGGLVGSFDYDRDLFDADTIVRLEQQLETLLRNALAAPDRPLAQLSLLPAAQRAQLLALGDGGAPAPCAHNDLYSLFAAQAARTPDAPALVEPGRALSYRELLHRANGLGRRLRELGAGRESRVAVLTDRSIEALVAVLGVLAAGAAYVPLDPAHPDDRLQFLLEDTAAKALLAPPQWRARAQALGTHVPLLGSDETASSPQRPCDDIAADDAAYVIYTSGSTGQPKGVTVEHRGAVNLTLGFMAGHDFAGQRLLMIPPLVFDASVGDVFPALASGSALVLHPHPTELGPFELEAFCAEHHVSAIDAPAALWRRWSEGWAARKRDGALLPQLRLMMIGGESVGVEQVRRFAAITDGRVALSNHYGPTETSVCAAMLSTRDGAEFAARELPIGRPLPGVRLYVVDTHGELAPRGAAGELCIGGAGVARGYLNRPEQSAEAFPPDPFAPGGRLYRTGDLARWNADGTLQFLGRRDHQVKLRGFRIELGEIESALEAHPQVEAAAVLLREDRPGDKRLVAYLVADPGSGPAQWREHLARSLPEALLPSAYVRLEAMPLNRNGKIDRRALPEPSEELLEQRPLVEPSTDTERAVLAVWREVLGRERISADDDFFAIGGDSLMTLPLVFKLHAALAVEVPLATVFAAPTLAALARRIDELRAGGGEDEFDLAAQVRLDDDIHPRNAALPAASRAHPRSVLITGATGFLGAYMVRELLDVSDAEILCLVRAGSDEDGLARIRNNLRGYELWREGDEARLRIVPGDLALPRLGLDEAAFDALAQRAEAIFHNGGQVNFLAPYEHLEAANVGGTREVLRLATRHRVKPVHLVSTLGVCLTASNLDRTVRESDPPPRADEQYGGYNQSKWVGEQLALLARERGLPVAIYRPARITGDSHTGASNAGDYFNAWIRGCVQLGRAPHLPDEAFDMAPVDYVGRAIVRIALGAGEANGTFHFYNRRRLPIPDAVRAMREAGLQVEEIDYPQWRRELLAQAAVSRENALAPFAGLFPEHPNPREPQFDCSASTRAVEPLGLICPPADAALMRLYLRFLQARGVLPAPAEAEA
ncbi:non-ribosomal peptide synthetase [Lysobacter enzymogenes]|uniref:non-ribosomal peptide synthetase n=1 Tax=Lysobacter enzymogenes TaxID=69 RepID=UPI00099C6C31|nr:non-ribosomal peptide synthetase [Lysobacter enzymogenes]UZW60124.1 non-ribosomal peptide synthetase [Lysobacter enzymogenes]